jgi:HK97 gp10 family phage protein
MSVKISATDLKNLNKKLDNLKKFDKQTLSNELGRTGLDIASKAKKAAPVDKGTLKQSIKSERKGKSVEVIAGANYAPYIEFGTGGMVKLDDMLELGIPASYAEQFKGKGIKEVNLPARPYFFSSAREGLNDLFIRLKKELRKSVK